MGEEDQLTVLDLSATAGDPRGQPIGRHGEPDDIAQAVRYLAGPESSWVTGQLLTVDGGHTLRSFVDYGSLLDLPDQGAVARGDTPIMDCFYRGESRADNE